MKDKVGLVTGASSGIGASVAELLRERGAQVVLADVSVDAGKALAERVGGHFIECDVASPESWQQLIERCLAEVGVPDFVHLNAGIMTVRPDAAFKPIDGVSLESYRRIMSINLDGVFFGLHGLLPHMRSRGGGITVTSSVAGLIGVGSDPIYSATKHALVGLVRSVAESLEGSPLRVNAICPGAVNTHITPDAMKTAFRTMPARVMAEEVVDLLVNGASGEIRAKVTEHASPIKIEPLTFEFD